MSAAALAIGVAVSPLASGPAGATAGVLATVPVGSLPDAAVFSSSNDSVYVANGNSNTVSVISDSSYQVTTVNVGITPDAIAFDSENGDVYVANYTSDTVTVINSSNTVIASPAVDQNPVSVVFDPSNGDVYVLNSNTSDVSVISGTSFVTNVPVGSSASGQGYAQGIAVDPVDDEVYVVDHASAQVSVINGATNSPATTTVDVGSSPDAIAYDPANDDVYVANSGSHSVTALAGATADVLATVTVGQFPRALVADPDDGEVYVANYSVGTVSAIATSNNEVTTIALSGFIYDIAFDPIDGNVYVPINPSTGADAVTVIDPANNTVLQSVSVGQDSDPEAEAVDSSTGDVFVADRSFSGNVSVLGTIPVPAVSALYPASGPIAGGTQVTITGENFSGANAVDFGSTPAQSFTCGNTSCTAVSPASGTTGSVDVSVTTGWGTSSTVAAANFAYYVSCSPSIGLVSCAISGGAAVSGGSLSIAAPAALSWSASLTGVTQSVDEPAALDPIDATGSGAGWQVLVTSTSFTSTSPTATLPPSALTINGDSSPGGNDPPTASCAVGSTCTTAVSAGSVAYPLTVPAGASAPAAVGLYAANSGTGLGAVDLASDWWLTIPASATAATYTSTISLAIASGP
jgi:YVTN family beta-propeller protein